MLIRTYIIFNYSGYFDQFEIFLIYLSMDK